jgi:predicted lipid-binding transport protein (Tim44 family)
MKTWATALLICAIALTTIDAEAKRIGGGGSLGRQSSNVTQRQSTPPASPAAPAQQQNAAQAAPRPANTPPAAAPARKPWGAMLGGLAAGLGLAWLAHSLGLGAAFGNVLLVLLLAFVVMAVIGMFMRSRRSPAPSAPTGLGSGLAYEGAAAGAGSAATQPVSLRQYSPEKVGNDASARPWERSSMAFDASSFNGQRQGAVIGSALSGSQTWGVPADFDTQGFLQSAKNNFVTLQDAWDRADIATLRSMMTDGMVDEIRTQLTEREAHLGGQPNKTEVVMIDARLLGIEDLGQDYMASVEYSGLIREQPSAGPSPFREVWNMTKPKSGTSGWLVAGVQALQ